jgi:hypothetical protein
VRLSWQKVALLVLKFGRLGKFGEFVEFSKLFVLQIAIFDPVFGFYLGIPKNLLLFLRRRQQIRAIEHLRLQCGDKLRLVH